MVFMLFLSFGASAFQLRGVAFQFCSAHCWWFRWLFFVVFGVWVSVLGLQFPQWRENIGFWCWPSGLTPCFFSSCFLVLLLHRCSAAFCVATYWKWNTWNARFGNGVGFVASDDNNRQCVWLNICNFDNLFFLERIWNWVEHICFLDCTDWNMHFVASTVLEALWTESRLPNWV